MLHNLRGYDGHLIIKNAYNATQSLDKHVDISEIPNNSEKFMSISIGYLRFIDSMQFMPCSLEKIVELYMIRKIILRILST